MTRHFVDVSTYDLETVRFVEAPADGVRLENVQLRDVTPAPGIIHQGAANAASLMAGVYKQPSDFVADERYETGDVTIDHVDRRLRLREPFLRDLAPLTIEELVIREGMANPRCPIPDIEQPV